MEHLAKSMHANVVLCALWQFLRTTEFINLEVAVQVLSWLEAQVSAKEGGNLTRMETMTPFPPNYSNFEMMGLSGRAMGGGAAAGSQGVCLTRQTNSSPGTAPSRGRAPAPALSRPRAPSPAVQFRARPAGALLAPGRAGRLR